VKCGWQTDEGVCGPKGLEKFYRVTGRVVGGCASVGVGEGRKAQEKPTIKSLARASSLLRNH